MRKNPIPLVYSSYHQPHAPRVEFLNGQLVSYPEVPKRVEVICNHLLTTNMVTLIEPDTPISKDEIARIHDRGMVDYLEKMSGNVEELLAGKGNIYKDVESLAEKSEYFYAFAFPTRPFMKRMVSSSAGHHGSYCFDTEGPIGKGTWEAIVFSATVAATGASLLLENNSNCVYALCRPPGHHAGTDFFGGFCYFNNAAIAANRMLKYGKVAIVDIDYHHGNGTQEIFWEEPHVFYGSIHANPDIEYPYYSGYSDEFGGQRAKQTNMNIPLPKGAGGEEYLSSLKRLLQIISEFEPNSVIVSVGFDTYIDDPVGFFRLNLEDYKKIGSYVSQLNVPTLFVQEGGYALENQGFLAEKLIAGFTEEQDR